MPEFARTVVDAPDLATHREHGHDDAQGEWILRRNCCLTPRQLLASFGLICLISVGIGVAFWMQGAPLVMPFVGLELLALGVAFLVYARHAADVETVSLRGAELRVEHRCAGRVEQVALRAQIVRIAAPGVGALVELTCAGRRIAVGRYVSQRERARFAAEFGDALRRA